MNNLNNAISGLVYISQKLNNKVKNTLSLSGGSVSGIISAYDFVTSSGIKLSLIKLNNINISSIITA